MVRTFDITVLSAHSATSDTTHANETTHATNTGDNAAADVDEATHFIDAATSASVDIGDPDAADTTDADIQEYLTSFSASNPEQGCSTSVHSFSPPHTSEQPLADTPPLLPELPVQLNSNTSGTPLQLVVDQFPYGSPGTPISGAPHGTSVHQATQDSFGASI